MSALDRVLEVLPPIYGVAPDSILTQLLNVLALELDVLQEDIERMRRTHWVNFVYQLEDLEKLAALVGVKRQPWETLPIFRIRLLAHIKALLKGALGPNEIKSFVYDYLRGVADALPGLTFVPGLLTLTAEQAFRPDPQRPLLRSMALVENPPQLRRSAALLAISGRVPYLYRWEEHNRGLDETLTRFGISGRSEGRTAAPVLANLTTGDLIGYAGKLELGQTLLVAPAGDPATPRLAKATIDDQDVTSRLYSVSGFRLGVPIRKEDQDLQPLTPRLARGANQWVFLAVGLYNVEGLDHFFFAFADDQLREGAFDTTLFDHALFPSGPVAGLTMEWIEVEPASFEVQVPHHLVVEPLQTGEAERPAQQVADVLRTEVLELRGAGIRAQVRFVPFVEQQRQQVRVHYGWKFLPPEVAPTGRNERVSFGARFGETSLNGSRLE